MSRPRNERVEEGFRTWATEADRSDTKTAELMGEPRRTIAYWRATYGWEQRYLSERGPAADLAAVETRQILRMAGPAMAKRMLAILAEKRPLRNAIGDVVTGEDGQPVMVWAAKDSDAVNAAKIVALVGIGDDGPAVAQPSAYEARFTVPEEPPEPEEGEEEDIGKLRERAVAMLEQTVSRVNTRTEVKGRSQNRRRI